MNRLKSIIGCGTDGFCARLNHTIQEEDPELWNDLSLCPDDPPLPPPIPRVVALSHSVAPPSEVSLRGFQEMETESLKGEQFLDAPQRPMQNHQPCERLEPQVQEPLDAEPQDEEPQEAETQDEEVSINVEEFLLGAVKLTRQRQELCTSASPASSVHSFVSGSKSDIYRRFNGNEEFDGSSYSSFDKGSISFFACRQSFPRTSPVYKCSRPATASTTRSSTSGTKVSI